MSEGYEQKKYVLPTYYTCKGNLKERWFVQFQAMHIDTETLKTKRIVCPAKFETKKQRDIWAKETCQQITYLLQNGYAFGKPKGKQVKKNEPPPVLIKALETTLNTLAPTLRKKTVLTYSSSIEKFKIFIKMKYPDININDFKNSNAIEFRDYLLSELKNVSRTANNTISHLNTVYNHLGQRKTVPANPFKTRKLRTAVTTRNISITDIERDIIETYMLEHEPELFFFTRFVYYGFIRPVELNAIKVADIREDKKHILIRGIVFKNGKTETVQIINPLAREIQKMNLDTYQGSLYLLGKELQRSPYQAHTQRAFRTHKRFYGE